MNENFDLIIDLQRNQERQGPGSIKITEKAISQTGLKSKSNLKVADIGSGTGGQTRVLAGNLDGHIIAVDLFPEFLAELSTRAFVDAVDHKISTLKASMDQLPFEEESLDLIWSEGAIYNMGFEKGIKYWRSFLKDEGWLAVSDITWTTPDRPSELEEYWKNECPDIDTPDNKVKIMEANGFRQVNYFILPESAWLENYYVPLEKSYSEFLFRHQQSKEAVKLVEEYRQEAKFYWKYHAYYSYGFYIGQKI